MLEFLVFIFNTKNLKLVNLGENSVFNGELHYTCANEPAAILLKTLISSILIYDQDVFN
jgi:hypothetical protein